MSKLGFPPLIWTPTVLFEYTDLVHKYTPDPDDAVAHIESVFIVDYVTIIPSKGTVEFSGHVREFDYHGSLYELFNSLNKFTDLTPPDVYYETEGMPSLIMDGQTLTASAYTTQSTQIDYSTSSPEPMELFPPNNVDLDLLKQQWDAYGGGITDERWSFARQTLKMSDAQLARIQEIQQEFDAIPKTKTDQGYTYSSDADYIRAETIAREYMGWYNTPELMGMTDILVAAGGTTPLADLLGISVDDLLYLYSIPYYGAWWSGQGPICYCSAETGLAYYMELANYKEDISILHNNKIYKENAIGFDFEDINHTHITLYTGFRPYDESTPPEKRSPLIIHQWSNLPFSSVYQQTISFDVKNWKIQPAYIYYHDDDNFQCNGFGYNSFELPQNEPMIIPCGRIKLHNNIVKYDYLNYQIDNGNVSTIEDKLHDGNKYLITFKYTPLHSFKQPQVARSPYIEITIPEDTALTEPYESNWANVMLMASDGTTIDRNRGFGDLTYWFDEGTPFEALDGNTYATYGNFSHMDSPNKEYDTSLYKRIDISNQLTSVILDGSITYTAYNEYGEVIGSGSLSTNSLGGITIANFVFNMPTINLPSNSSTKYCEFFDPNLSSFLRAERKT